MKQICALKLILVLCLLIPFVSLADDDHDDSWRFWKKAQSNSQNNVNSPLYTEECGSCHMAYPPRFLSASVWQKVMASLDNHFGDNAELDDDVNVKLTNYLMSNAGNSRWNKNSNSQTMRISDSRYFVRKHHEVPSRAVGPNAQVKSYSNCQACHQNADKGSFREREIKIPGFRFWD